MRWRPVSRGSRRNTVVVVLCAAMLMMVGACSGGLAGTGMAAPDGSSQASTSSPATDDRAGPALAAYSGMWQDFVQAGATSDWQSPNLAHHAIGVALTNMSRALYADHYNGLVTKGEPQFSPSVQSVEPTSSQPTKVIVTDCADTTKWLKYHLDGKPVGGGGGRSRITGIVEKQSDGSWKVSDYAVQDLGSCG